MNLLVDQHPCWWRYTSVSVVRTLQGHTWPLRVDVENGSLLDVVGRPMAITTTGLRSMSTNR